MNKKADIIGLTGTNGAGKGEAASFFMANGYAYISLSDIVREELQKENREVTRDNMIRMGNALRRRFSPDILARRAAAKIAGKTVIDSIRNQKEVEFLRRQGSFILLSIDAPAGLRFERVKKRGREESAASLEEFVAKEAEETSTDERKQQLRSCIDMADRTIVNDGTLEELWKKLEEFL